MLSGPGLWLDWLAELDRASLLEKLMAGDVISQALEQAPHGHACDRTLTAKVTLICVLVACLFPGQGYDGVLAAASGVPAGGSKPQLRIVAHARTGSRRWIAAATGGYRDGGNALADELASSFVPGILNPMFPCCW